MRLFQAEQYARDYYVAFRKSDKFSWWNLFIGKELGHCLAFTPLVSGSWIMIDTTLGGIFIVEYLTKEHIFNDITSKFDYIVEIRTDYGKLFSPRYKGLITCVSVIKNLLGIKKWWIISPKQLLRELEKNGRIIWRSK